MLHWALKTMFLLQNLMNLEHAYNSGEKLCFPKCNQKTETENNIANYRKAIVFKLSPLREKFSNKRDWGWHSALYNDVKGIEETNYIHTGRDFTEQFVLSLPTSSEIIWEIKKQLDAVYLLSRRIYGIAKVTSIINLEESSAPAVPLL